MKQYEGFSIQNDSPNIQALSNWLKSDGFTTYCHIDPNLRDDEINKAFQRLEVAIDYLDSTGIDFSVTPMSNYDVYAIAGYCEIIGEHLNRLVYCFDYSVPDRFKGEFHLLKELRNKIAHELSTDVSSQKLYLVAKYVVLDPKYKMAVDDIILNIRVNNPNSFVTVPTHSEEYRRRKKDRIITRRKFLGLF